jgi:hypothetical protein
LIFRYQIFAFGQDARVCNTFQKGVPSQGIAAMDAPSAMVAHSKVFIVARNKHIVPKERRVERLLSGYSIRESRDDSRGRYWYVVAALEVVMVAQGTLT